MKSFSMIFALCAVTVSTASFAQNAPVSEQSDAQQQSVEVKPGDTWSYKSMDEITGNITGTVTYTVTELKDDNIVARINIANGNQNFTYPGMFDHNWGVLINGIWKYAPANAAAAVHFPIKLNDEWSYKVSVTRASPDLRFSESGTVHVVAKEPITLPSGLRYDEAYRIEAKSHGAPAAVQTQTVQSNYETTTTTWYVPSVNRYVKRTIETRQDGLLQTKTTEYLVSYTPRLQ